MNEPPKKTELVGRPPAPPNMLPPSFDPAYVEGAVNSGRLVRKTDGPEQITGIMNTMMKYGREVKGGAAE
jgi:hypothetical protein